MTSQINSMQHTGITKFNSFFSSGAQPKLILIHSLFFLYVFNWKNNSKTFCHVPERSREVYIIIISNEMCVHFYFSISSMLHYMLHYSPVQDSMQISTPAQQVAITYHQLAFHLFRIYQKKTLEHMALSMPTQ